MSWIDYDKWEEIFDSIAKHKLRTALTAFGVSWGMFMLVLLLGMGNGFQNGVNHNFTDDATNSLWFWTGSTSKPFKGLKPGRNIEFHNADVEAVETSIKEVEHMAVRYWLRGGAQIKKRNKVFDFQTRCINPGHKYLENTLIEDGRFLNENDMKTFAKVAVIGRKVKESLFPDGGDPIGTLVNIKGIEFKIIGVFYDEGSEREMRNIYLPYTTAQKTSKHFMFLTTWRSSWNSNPFLQP